MPKNRVYLDWNATAPLRAEARAAMIAAMDVVGNPSSVHAEGRAAKAIVEKARGQVATLAGCEPDEIIFTSGATEAAALAVRGSASFSATDIEHDCVRAWSNAAPRLVSSDGVIQYSQTRIADREAVQAANSETGVLQPLDRWFDSTPHVIDAVQALGKIPFNFDDTSGMAALASAHKIGGPKGVGALVLRKGHDINALIRGGGQEMGRRSGTENVAGIAGFGAAAEAAQHDLATGVWEPIAELRDNLEDRLADAAPELIVAGENAPRLPNTMNIAVPGWKGEIQVIQMDLAGFAVSSGSACSSGKVKASQALRAMGFDDQAASSAIRVSLGPTTTKSEVDALADAWIAAHRRWKKRSS